jgi:ferredoxin
VEIDSHRTIQPLKSFLLFFHEQITNITKFPNLRNFALMGLKACDLYSLLLYDKVFLEGEFIEPFYKRRRQDLLLVSSDCQDPLDTCFCTVLAKKPYPEEYFDINLASVSTGLIVEVNSSNGEGFIRLKKDIFNKIADRSILAKREARRRAACEKVQRINAKWPIKAPFLELIQDNKANSAVWVKAAGQCVGCGACTQICPDCYCFFLEEAKLKNQDAWAKCRYWDSCQYARFSKMAENVNPRKDIWQRFRHRYLHKFDYIRENFGFDGCTGCGRCIQACCGNIDMRNVLSELKNA